MFAWFSSINISAQAETLIKLTQASGKVFLNTGTSYIIAQPVMELNPGDRILILQNSSARLDYPGNCAIQVKSNSLFTVGKKDQCLQTANRLRIRWPLQQLLEQNGTVIVPAEATASVISPTPAVITAVEGAGAVGAAATTPAVTAAVEGAGAVGVSTAAGPTLFGVPAAVVGAGSATIGAAAITAGTSSSGNFMSPE